MIKVIIFDFDGVICDSVNIKTVAFKELYKEYGEDIVNKVVSYHLQNGGVSRFEKIKYFHNNLLKKHINEEEVTIIANDFSIIVKNKVIASNYINGVYDFIKNKSKKHNLYICTGTPEVEMVEILNEKKINMFFSNIYGSPKLKTEIINIILNNCKVNSNEVLFFGDTLTDYFAAQNTKVNFIGIENEHVEFPKEINTIKDFNDSFLELIFYQFQNK